MMIEPIWWYWAIFDEDGLCGIDENAPEEIKEEYKKFLEEEKKRKEQHIKI